MRFRSSKAAVIMIFVATCSSFRLGRMFLGNQRNIRSIISAQSKYIDSDRSSIIVTASPDVKYNGDLLIIPFYQPKVDSKDDKVLADELIKNIPLGLSSEVKDCITGVLEEGLFKGDVMSKQITRISGLSSPVRYVALIGLGKDPKKGDAVDLEISSASRLGKAVANSAKEIKAKTVGIIMPNGTANAGVLQFILGLHDASYNDNRYKKVPTDGFKPNPLTALALLGCSEAVSTDIAMNSKFAEMIGSGVSFAKDLVGTNVL